MADQSLLAPNFTIVLKNIAAIFPGLQLAMGYVFILIACIMVYNAFMDLVYMAISRNHPSVIFGKRSANGGFVGVVIKLLCAGFIINFVTLGELGNIASSLFLGDDHSYVLVNIQNYVPQKNESDGQKYAMICILSLAQTMGFYAIFKGVRMASAISDRTSRASPWHALLFVIAGAACLQITKVLAIIQNTLGFNVLHLFGIN